MIEPVASTRCDLLVPGGHIGTQLSQPGQEQSTLPETLEQGEIMLMGPLLLGPWQLQGRNLTVLGDLLCPHSRAKRALLFNSSSRLLWPHFREDKREGRDGT